MGSAFSADSRNDIHVTDRKALVLQWILERNDWLLSRPKIVNGKVTQLPLDTIRTPANPTGGGSGSSSSSGVGGGSSSSSSSTRLQSLNTIPDPNWSRSAAAQVFLEMTYGGPQNVREARSKLGLPDLPMKGTPVSADLNNADSSAMKSRVAVRPKNHRLLPFLDENVLPIVAEFLFGGSLLRCMEVSPLWFCCFLDVLDKLANPIDLAFKNVIDATGILQLEYARTDWSPLHVCQPGVRIDRVLIAKVLPSYAGHTVRLSYESAYETVPSQPYLRKAELASQIYDSHFQFDIFSGSRNLWIHKDICRFHGDETRVAALQNITPVRVGDRIEIAVNLFNAYGKTAIKSIKWKPPRTAWAPSFRSCPVEEEHDDWMDFDSFAANSTERLQNPNFFGPQLQHRSTEYAGLDVATSRSILLAKEVGAVPLADKILGLRIEILPKHSPIILPLKRVGLLHDRFTKIQLRQGDVVKLFISQGGRMVQQQEQAPSYMAG